MKILGRPTIHPILFYSGKVAGYLTWTALLLSIIGLVSLERSGILIPRFFSYISALIGIGVAIVSMVNLGRSTTLGLPTHATTFRTNGLYKLGRNPMYVGFDLITLGSMAFHGNIGIAVLGAYSICIYHFIVLGEERYLAERFADEFTDYCKRVRRYI